jgi:hypothetical protein
MSAKKSTRLRAKARRPERSRARSSDRLPSLAQIDELLSGPAGPTPSVEDERLNGVALALTRRYGRLTLVAPDGRTLVEELHGGLVRLEVRTDSWFHTSASVMPNVYVRVYRRTRIGYQEVARRSSGRGLLEGGDLRPALAERLLEAVARLRQRPLPDDHRTAAAGS